MKVRIQAAKARGKAAYAALILMIIGLIAVAITLVFGAMLLPGFLLPGLFEDLKSIPLSIIALVFISQLLVMRHFQVIMSRRMAMKRLKNRLKDLNDDVLVKLDALESAPEGEMKEAILEDLKSQYYSIAIYDLIEQDFFGYSPIYLFGLRLRYILDEDVLAHINVAPKGEEPKKGSEGVEPANEGKVSTDLYSSLEHWMFSKDVHESLKNWKLSEDLQAVQELWKISIEEKEEGTRIEMHSITIIKHLKE
jgi:ABC-type multidrug transport system fused ATPase/permease subunit